MINAKLDQVNIGLKLYTFLFLTCFTLFWGLYKRTGLGLFSYMAADFVLFMVAAVFTVALMIQNGGRVRLKHGCGLFVSLFLLVVAGILHTGAVATEQPLYLTLSEAFPYISVCLEAFVLSRLIRSKRDLNWFMDAVEAASIIIAVFSILQFALYPSVIIFPTDELPLRNGLPRLFIGGGSILSIGALISMGNLFSNRDRKGRSFLNLVLVIVTLILVRQARSNTICLIFVLLAGVLSVSNIPKPVRYTVCAGMVGLVVVGLLYDNGSSVITLVTEADTGIQARMNGIRFFLDRFVDYPVLGMGFITTSGNIDPVSYRLLCSPSGYRYDRSDVGIIGLLNMMGILGVIWYAAFLQRIGRNARSVRAINGQIHGKLIFWYLLMTSANLIVMTMQMSMMIALTVVMIDKMLEFSIPGQERGTHERDKDRNVWSQSSISQ